MGFRRAIKSKVEELKDYLEKEEEETGRIIAEQILEEELEEEEPEEGFRDSKKDMLSLKESIRKLDHIRWFLDHQKGYTWNGCEEEVRLLGRLMKEPGKNREEIIENYLLILRRFLNDPFRTFIILDDADEAAGKASSIDRFFVLIDNMPVPIGFLRRFDRKLVSSYGNTFERNRKALLARVRTLCARAGSAAVPDPSDAASYQGKAGGFVFFGACLMAALLIMSCIDILGSHYRPGFEFLKRYLPGTRTFIQILGAEYNLRWYLFCGGMAALSLLIVFLLLITVIRTASRYINIKNDIYIPAKKKQELEETFEQEVPQDIDLLESIIRKGFEPAAPVQTLRTHDYREKVRMIEEMESFGEKDLKKPVTAGGRFLLVIGILMIAWFSSRFTGLLPETVNGQWTAEGYVVEYDFNE